MPLPEGYLPREGDVLIVHGKVKHDVDAGEKHVYLAFRKYDTTHVDLAEVVGVYSLHWNVGDWVTFPGMYGIGKVLATHEDQVWAVFTDEPPQTFSANELKRAPDEPEPIEEPAEAPPAIPEPPPAAELKEEPL